MVEKIISLGMPEQLMQARIVDYSYEMSEPIVFRGKTSKAEQIIIQ